MAPRLLPYTEGGHLGTGSGVLVLDAAMLVDAGGCQCEHPGTISTFFQHPGAHPQTLYRCCCGSVLCFVTDNTALILAIAYYP